MRSLVPCATCEDASAYPRFSAKFNATPVSSNLGWTPARAASIGSSSLQAGGNVLACHKHARKRCMVIASMCGKAESTCHNRLGRFIHFERPVAIMLEHLVIPLQHPIDMTCRDRYCAAYEPPPFTMRFPDIFKRHAGCSVRNHRRGSSVKTRLLSHSPPCCHLESSDATEQYPEQHVR